MIDTGRGGEHTEEILRFLRDSAAAPRAVLNTHWHLDHIGGNADFRREWPEAPIHAHPALDSALAGFHAANRAELEKLLPTIESPSLQKRLETELALLKLDRELAADEPVTASDGDIWIL